MVAFQSANTDKTQSVLQQGTYPSFQNIPEYSHAFRRHVYHSFSFLSLFLSYYQAYLRPISSFSFFMSSCFYCLLPTLFSSFSVFYLLIFPFFCSPTLSHSSRFLSFTFLFFLFWSLHYQNVCYISPLFNPVTLTSFQFAMLYVLQYPTSCSLSSHLTLPYFLVLHISLHFQLFTPPIFSLLLFILGRLPGKKDGTVIKYSQQHRNQAVLHSLYRCVRSHISKRAV